MRRVLRLALLVVLPALPACGGGVDRPHFAPLDTDGDSFRDELGRTVILRGVNARVAGVFDVSFDDGRMALEPIPDLTAADCAHMAELGFDVLRLPISWSAVEPARGQFDDAYLGAVDAAIECAGNAGIYVLVDFHQDAYSKEIGEDGAPLWAIQPAPTMLLQGPLDDLGDRRNSKQVTDAFASFFAAGDPDGLQADFIDALAHVATRYANDPHVVGFEVFNEPQTTSELLYAFTFAAAARVREAAPAKLVFFEPPVVRNILDYQPLADAPFPVAGAVYAPHVYTLVFSDPGNVLATIGLEDLRPSVESARQEARAWGTPLFIGEFGAGPDTTNFAAYLGYELDLQDAYAASSTFWVWKEQSQGRWGLFDENAGVWSERPAMIDVVSRPYAPRIAGTPTSIAWDAAAKTLTVAYEQAVGAPNVVFVPERFAVSGAAVATSGGPRTVEIACGGGGAHTIVVSYADATP